MLSDCHPCREAGAVCHVDPKLAAQLHKECRMADCLCEHVVPEKPIM